MHNYESDFARLNHDQSHGYNHDFLLMYLLDVSFYDGDIQPGKRPRS
ncbi:hypothetical protein I8751_22730 [Nostocaceae cyanobacterium CENA357]|uniref:Uncharacterized protein n=1 Tax=Atlanticothrix silvestris CENA357 TaxID=1725252 RepID=A0A8J7L7H4_9CYAN|nr:hypothetical protein [Atlanticothrix silvestris CENA357]